MKPNPQGVGRLRAPRSPVDRYEILYDRDDPDLCVAEEHVARILSESDVVGTYYVKNGCAWWEGVPGEALRKVRAAVERLFEKART